jgi:hypothetical protein
MNPFGTTRQNVAGDGAPLPKRKQWWVPFGPCHIPPQMVAWPLDAIQNLGLVAMFEQCKDGLFGDARTNLVVPPGPLLVPGDSSVVANNPGKRTWAGTIRASGSGLRTLLFSSVYSGPARATWLEFSHGTNFSGAQVGGVAFGAIPGGSANIIKQPRASVPFPSGAVSFYDLSVFSDNEQPPVGDVWYPEAMEQQSTPVNIEIDIEIPWNTFSLFILMDTAAPQADVVSWAISFAPAKSAGGQIASSQSGPNQFNQLTYLGGSRPGF